MQGRRGGQGGYKGESLKELGPLKRKLCDVTEVLIVPTMAIILLYINVPVQHVIDIPQCNTPNIFW